MNTALIARLAVLVTTTTGLTLCGEDLWAPVAESCGCVLDATGDLIEQAKQALHPMHMLERIRSLAPGPLMAGN